MYRGAIYIGGTIHKALYSHIKGHIYGPYISLLYIGTTYGAPIYRDPISGPYILGPYIYICI